MDIDDYFTQNTERMRAASGNVTVGDPLVTFLYLLMRNIAPTGALEDLVAEAHDAADAAVVFTNGWLAEYAQDMAARLRVPA